MLLCDLQNGLILEHRATSRSERGVRLDLDSLALAELDELELRVVRVKLDLVHRGDDLSRREDLVELELGAVGDTDGADFARCEDSLELGPGLGDRPLGVDVAGAIGERGEERVVAVGVERDGPVHQEHYGSV